MTELKDLSIDEISFVDAGANPQANILLFKRQTQKDEPAPTAQTSNQTESTSPNFDELTATLQALTDKLNAQLAQAEANEFRIRAERYEILGVDADKLAQMLMAASKSNPQMYETAIKVLDGALNAVQKSGTFSEVGKRGDSPAQSDVQKLAAQIQKSDSKLTYRQALDKAYLQLGIRS